MKLPTVISNLVAAQDRFDAAAYSKCFSAAAVVFDEGKTHQGPTEIARWIASANKKYNTVMKPISYHHTGSSSILTAEISGTFEGGPLILKYHFEILDGLIQSLRITG